MQVNPPRRPTATDREWSLRDAALLASQGKLAEGDYRSEPNAPTLAEGLYALAIERFAAGRQCDAWDAVLEADAELGIDLL